MDQKALEEKKKEIEEFLDAEEEAFFNRLKSKQLIVPIELLNKFVAEARSNAFSMFENAAKNWISDRENIENYKDTPALYEAAVVSGNDIFEINFNSAKSFYLASMRSYEKNSTR